MYEIHNSHQISIYLLVLDDFIQRVRVNYYSQSKCRNNVDLNRPKREYAVSETNDIAFIDRTTFRLEEKNEISGSLARRSIYITTDKGIIHIKEVSDADYDPSLYDC